MGTSKGVFILSVLSDAHLTYIVVALGFTQATFSSLIFLQYLVVKVPVMYEDCDRNPVRVIIKANLPYYVLYTAFAIMGAIPSWSYIYFSFHLLDIVNRNSTVKTVVDAVIIPRLQLAAVFKLGIYTLFIFAMLQFMQYPADLEGGECKQLWTCFVAYVSLGVRNGGGIGDSFMEHDVDHWGEWILRTVAVPLIFFMMFTVVLMNVIFGVIIDTFGEMREEEADSLQERSERCFICNLESADFDKAGLVWLDHIGHRGSGPGRALHVGLPEVRRTPVDEGPRRVRRHRALRRADG